MPADVEAVRQKVLDMLAEVSDVYVDDDRDFSIEVGDTRGFVRVASHPDHEHIVVTAFSPVLFDVDLSPGLFEYLARNGDAMIFGHLILAAGDAADTDTVMVIHRLLGETLDADSLIYALLGVATSAAQIAQDMQPHFGGTRMPVQ